MCHSYFADIMNNQSIRIFMVFVEKMLFIKLTYDSFTRRRKRSPENQLKLKIFLETQIHSTANVEITL